MTIKGDAFVYFNCLNKKSNPATTIVQEAKRWKEYQTNVDHLLDKTIPFFLPRRLKLNAQWPGVDS